MADTASAILCVMLNAPQGEAYNIATTQSTATIYEYACAMARTAGVNVEISPTATATTNADSVLDATKLINLGWQPQYDLEQGIKHTLQQKQQ